MLVLLVCYEARRFLLVAWVDVMGPAEVVAGPCVAVGAGPLRHSLGIRELSLHVACAASHLLQGSFEVFHALVQVVGRYLCIRQVRQDAESTLESAQEAAVVSGGLLMLVVAASSCRGERRLQCSLRVCCGSLAIIIVLATLKRWQLEQGPNLPNAEASSRVGAAQSAVLALVQVL